MADLRRDTGTRRRGRRRDGVPAVLPGFLRAPHTGAGGGLGGRPMTAARPHTSPGRDEPAGAGRGPGSVLIGWAGWLLAGLGGGLLFVSFSGQFSYLARARHQEVPSLIEAAMSDLGMIIFTLLALGLARAGKPARTERTLIMACSAASAAMNYAAADTASLRSVAAYVAAPVFLAVV